MRRIAAYEPAASEAKQRDFLTHLHATLNVCGHPVRNGLPRLTAQHLPRACSGIQAPET